jgi:hypothetical protein
MAGEFTLSSFSVTAIGERPFAFGVAVAEVISLSFSGYYVVPKLIGMLDEIESIPNGLTSSST